MGKPVPERTAAKLAGERFYWTGKPCRNGHVTKRYTSTGLCSACSIKNVLAYQKRAPEHPARIVAREAGEITYSTGVPCYLGHDLRWVSSGGCVECRKRTDKDFRKRHPGMEAEWARKSRAKDPTSHRKASIKWAKNNPDKTKKIRERMRARDPDLWRKKDLAKANEYRAKKAGNGGSFAAEDIDRIRERQNGLCAGCLKKAANLEIDHIVAIANGGSNDPSNLQLLCRPCNRSKGKKDAMIWLQTKHGRLL